MNLGQEHEKKGSREDSLRAFSALPEASEFGVGTQVIRLRAAWHQEMSGSWYKSSWDLKGEWPEVGHK